MIIDKMSHIVVSSVSNLAIKLWPGHSIQKFNDEFSKILISPDNIVFTISDNKLVFGFAHFSLRFDYVEGTSSSPVAYLEGIFIEEKYRRKGYAKELLNEGAKWAKVKKCIEMASDCEISNSVSQDFHLKHGFLEANRIVCYSKKI